MTKIWDNQKQSVTRKYCKIENIEKGGGIYIYNIEVKINFYIFVIF